MHTVSPVLTGVLREHDIGADHEADAQWPGLNDFELEIILFVPDCFAIAGGRVRNVTFRMGGLHTVLGRPDKRLVTSPSIAFDRTTPEDDVHAELV
jgi:hypothetical protein